VRLFWYCIFNLLARHNLADELGRVIVHLFEKFAQFKLLTSQIDFITQVLGLDKLTLLYEPLELILHGWCQSRFGADLFLDFRLLLGSQVFILPLLVAQRRQTSTKRRILIIQACDVRARHAFLGWRQLILID